MILFLTRTTLKNVFHLEQILYISLALRVNFGDYDFFCMVKLSCKYKCLERTDNLITS